jgi:hypothetical protein
MILYASSEEAKLLLLTSFNSGMIDVGLLIVT